MLKTFLRDPLLHFLLLGLILYWVIDAASPDERSELAQVIKVSDADIITLMQQKDQNFKPKLYQERFKQLTAEQKAALVDEFAEQEVLYREAVSLGLDKNDQVQRRRLIQKMKYFIEGFAEANFSLSDAEIKDFYTQHSDRYITPAQVSFTHIFFKTDPSNAKDASDKAERVLSSLETESSIESEVVRQGDLFPYHKNYLAKTQSQVSRHFGAEFANSVFQLDANDQQWQGPINSAYGAHIIKLLSKTKAQLPALARIETQVREDAQRDKQFDARKQQIEQLKSTYSVKTESD